MLRAPAAARAAFVPTAAAAALLLLALLARPAAAQSEAVQVPCNLQGANVDVANLGPAGGNKTGLLCGYTFGTYYHDNEDFNAPSATLTCYDSIQRVFVASVRSQSSPHLPSHGIVFHDFLVCTPPPSFPGTFSSPPQCGSAFIVYIALGGMKC